MPMPPCSDCTNGFHDSCDAQARTMCGCRGSGHQAAAPAAGPAVAPIADVLDAAVRAPRSALAVESDTVADGELEPVTAGAPPAPMADLLAPPAAPAAPEHGPTADPLTCACGHVAKSVNKLASHMGTPLPSAAPAEPPAADVAPDPVKAVMDALGPILGDSGALPELPGPSDEDALEMAELPEGVDMPADLVPGQVGLLSGAPEPTAPDTPVPASATGPRYSMAAERPANAYASLWDTEGAHLEGELPAGAMAEFIDLGASGNGAYALSQEVAQEVGQALDAALGSWVPPVGPPVEVSGELVETPALIPELPGPSDEDDDAFLAELRQAMEADAAEQDTLEASLDRAMEGVDLTGAVGKALEIANGIQTDADEILAPEPTVPDHVRALMESADHVLYVNGGTGDVVDADGQALPSHLADEILEHYDFDPTPLDGAPTPQSLPPEAPASYVGPGTLSRSLGSIPAGTVLRIQVARATTSCGECQVPIEPGNPIAARPGLGWCHLNHQTTA